MESDEPRLLYCPQITAEQNHLNNVSSCIVAMTQLQGLQSCKQRLTEPVPHIILWLEDRRG